MEDDDNEDEDDVGHEPDVDLLEVGCLGQVLLDRGLGGEGRGEGGEERIQKKMARPESGKKLHNVDQVLGRRCQDLNNIS